MVEKRNTLDGRFTNIRRIDPTGGGGNFSLLFVAQDNTTGSEVALKFFRPDRYTPTDFYRWESFRRESVLLERLRGCKDVVALVCPQSEFTEYPIPSMPFYEIKFAYYALELAHGNLQDEIAKGTLSPESLLTYFRTIVRSLQRIHSRRIAHRDLKPANLLITASGIALSDFGTARLLDDTSNGLQNQYIFPPGDQRYSSPEMMACLHDVEAKFAFHGDFFSLGAVLFEMFTGMNLGVNLFGAKLLTDLTLPLSVVPRNQRLGIFNQIISSIEVRYPLPSIQAFNMNLPPCIHQRLNDLFKHLCCLDYRRRLISFPSIFRSIDGCLLILRNEAQYLSWQKEKERRRAVRVTKNGATK